MIVINCVGKGKTKLFDTLLFISHYLYHHVFKKSFETQSRNVKEGGKKPFWSIITIKNKNFKNNII